MVCLLAAPFACGDDARSKAAGDGTGGAEGDGIRLEGTDEGADSLEGGNSASSPLSAGNTDSNNPGCGSVEVAIEATTATLVLLVDQSGSMNDNFQGQPRWDALYETLMDEDDGVISNLDERVRFGFTLYSSVSTNNSVVEGVCPRLVTVDPSLGNRDAIDQEFIAADPLDETPTGESIDAVAQTLAALDFEGPKGIVLATDGEPDTCDEPNPQNGREESLAAAQGAYDLGIRTFVISVGNEVGDGHLQELANVGIGRDTNSNDPAPFYKALNAAELADAFDTIVGSFTCEFAIDGLVESGRECEGTVVVDGNFLTCGTDWEVIDQSTLQFRGAACEALGDGEDHAVDAAWPCGVVVPIP